jgi:cytochrome c5
MPRRNKLISIQFHCRWRHWLLAAAIVASATPALAGEEASTELGAEATAGEFHEVAGTFVKKYCVSCHGGDEPEADLQLDQFADAAAMLEGRAQWEKVIVNLKLGVMPPDGNPLPPADEMLEVVKWIRHQFDEADRKAPPNPGRVTMRRLNRAEYNNTIRDLIGVDFQPAADFPSDDVGYGFDNIGDVLSLPPLLMEKYLAAAERITGEAIVVDRTVRPRRQRIELETLRRSNRSRKGTVVLASNGDAGTTFSIPYPGEYAIRIRAFADQAGPDKAQMALKVNGEAIAQFEVAATDEQPEVYESRQQLEPGDRKVAASFLNDYYEPDDSDSNNRDRNLFVDYLEVEGPFDFGLLPLPPSHERLITIRPAHDDGAEGEADWRHAAREVLVPFARRAFRRPASNAEIERLVQLVLMARAERDNFETGIQLAVQAILVSPHFLFRVELDGASASATAQVAGEPSPEAQTVPWRIEPLDDYQLASRLSYFLWSSMPDEALLAEAAAGTLRAPDRWEAQVRRMLADPKSEALVANFAGQWLQLRSLTTITPDRKRYPDFDESLRRSMRRETELFFAELVRDDRSVLDLLDADFTYVDERLAKHYGIEGITGDEFQRVTVDRNRRGGILSQASVLTVTSNPTRTSPVKRGKWVLEQILNSPPPPPPPGVPELADDSGKQLTGTLRERMQQHRENVSCASCHQLMDPIGFGLENYDAIGAWRDNEGEAPIDPAGELPDGTKFSGPAELKQVFRGKAAEFRRTLATKMLTFALGRGTEHYDRRAIDAIAAAMEADEDRFSRLILEVARSQPFQMRQAPISPSAAATVEIDEAGGTD